MEEQRNTQALLAQIPQPGFLVQKSIITAVNQAAASLQLAPGQAFSGLLPDGQIPKLSEGLLSLDLTVAGQPHPAAITKMEDSLLVLLETREELEEFRSMALVALELKKPLMQAITNARQLGGDGTSAAKMNRSLLQMLRLASNMSDISRYRASARMEVRDVDSFLLELFEKAQTLTEGQIFLQYEGLKYPIFSQIDSEQLERAIWNILSNCIRFTPAGGSITARLIRREKFLHLTIEDSGSGIAQTVQTGLFQRYLRQPGIEDSRYGLGLGLAIVRTVVRNHGGALLVSSGKAGGTRITMILALRQEDGLLCPPAFRPDYAGGFDHGLVELSDCLGTEFYEEI